MFTKFIHKLFNNDKYEGLGIFLLLFSAMAFVWFLSYITGDRRPEEVILAEEREMDKRRIEFLFDRDGIKYYRFEDNNQWVYFTDRGEITK